MSAQPVHQGRARRDGRFFDGIRSELERAAGVIAEIHDHDAGDVRAFGEEHGLELARPPPFSLLKYQKEFDRLERAYITALQYAVEHAQQGEVRADAPLLRDARVPACEHVYESPTGTPKPGCAR